MPAAEQTSGCSEKTTKEAEDNDHAANPNYRPNDDLYDLNYRTGQIAHQHR